MKRKKKNMEMNKSRAIDFDIGDCYDASVCAKSIRDRSIHQTHVDSFDECSLCCALRKTISMSLNVVDYMNLVHCADAPPSFRYAQFIIDTARSLRVMAYALWAATKRRPEHIRFSRIDFPLALVNFNLILNWKIKLLFKSALLYVPKMRSHRRRKKYIIILLFRSHASLKYIGYTLYTIHIHTYLYTY